MEAAYLLVLLAVFVGIAAIAFYAVGKLTSSQR